MQKPPPVYQTQFVFHPEQDTSYVLFEHASSNPFQPSPVGGVPRVNAWWLAEAALAWYWQPAEAAAIFETAGLSSKHISAAATDAYVAWQEDWLLVTFRGTEPDQLEDSLTDAALALVPWTSGRVHYGFKKALDVIWPTLMDTLDGLAPGRAVWFCGHSLGAALATLAADRFVTAGGVCTFGSPRVGDRAFAAAATRTLSGRMLRFVNNHDVVTHVPPPLFAYKHIDLRRQIARNGAITAGEPSVPHFFSDLIGEPRLLAALARGTAESAPSFAPAFLLDHMPKAYAIWTWNDYDKNR